MLKLLYSWILIKLTQIELISCINLSKYEELVFNYVYWFQIVINFKAHWQNILYSGIPGTPGKDGLPGEKGSLGMVYISKHDIYML